MGSDWQCERCGNEGWVCEKHPTIGWTDCSCGAAGDPCPVCNPCDEHNPPKMPLGTKEIGDE